MIKLQIIGHIGKDCTVNSVNGKNVINFNVAHSERFKDAQGVQKDKTTWVDCAYWTDRTAVAPYLKKGTLVFAEGQPEVRNYTAKDGSAGSSLTLRISSVQLLGAKNEGQGGESQPAYAGSNSGQNNYSGSNNVPSTQASEITEPLDDLPF